MDSGAFDGVDSLLQGLWMTRLRKPWPPAPIATTSYHQKTTLLFSRALRVAMCD